MSDLLFDSDQIDKRSKRCMSFLIIIIIMFIFFLRICNNIILFIISDWKITNNKRQVFDEYAKKEGFDTRVPENWYNQPRHNLINLKVSF